MKTINVIATTISGSIKDWKKIELIKEEFEEFYEGDIKVYVVDSHKEAREKTRELVKKKEKIIVSAGGAGTFNSVLEGSIIGKNFPVGLRLAFLRKGSADLIGKVLNIPDNLHAAAEIISKSIKQDHSMEADVIEVNINNKEYHFIGFGGVGIFGIVPYFTESRFKRYYKGILGQFFGDRGPFISGLILSTLKYYKDKFFRKIRFIVDTGEKTFTAEQYSSIIIMNGDLGKDFPLAREMPLGSGYFKVILLKDFGFLNTCRQIKHTWQGDLKNYEEKLGVEMLKTKSLTIKPEKSIEYLVNNDGLLVKTKEQINYRISDSIKLIKK
jgi:diacylglycerol kinase family enzyme